MGAIQAEKIVTLAVATESHWGRACMHLPRSCMEAVDPPIPQVVRSHNLRLKWSADSDLSLKIWIQKRHIILIEEFGQLLLLNAKTAQEIASPGADLDAELDWVQNICILEGRRIISGIFEERKVCYVSHTAVRNFLGEKGSQFIVANKRSGRCALCRICLSAQGLIIGIISHLSSRTTELWAISSEAAAMRVWISV